MVTMASYVRRYALDKLLSADLLGELAPFAQKPGELIVRSGDPARHLYFLVEGRAKVYSTMENGQNLLATITKPLDVLGEVELFTLRRSMLNVEALTDTVCLRLPMSAVKKALDRNSRLLAYICSRLGAKLASRTVVSSINLRYPVRNRLASYLRAVADQLVAGTDDLGQIADFLGASYRQLARAVRGFRAEGILEARRGRIRVLDKGKLEPLARDRYD